MLKLANTNFGIWENELEDVRTDLVVHSLPYNNRCIAGVARLNDRFLSIADLSYCMGYPQVEDANRTVLVMPGDNEVAGFVTEGGLETVDSDENAIIPVEKCAQSSIVDSCVSYQSKLVPIINIAALHKAVQSADFVLSGKSLQLKKATQKKGEKKLHVVECNNNPFALQATDIKKSIARPEEITPISQLPDYAEGLILYDQKAVPLISLTRRIGFSAEDQSHIVLPICIKDQIICFLVTADRGKPESKQAVETLPPLVQSKWLENAIIRENRILPVIDALSLLLPDADEKIEGESDQYNPNISFEPGSNDTDVVELSLIGVKHAMPESEVKDSLDIQALTRIPNVSPMILGVVEYKGDIIPVLDLALCYGEVSSITPEWKMVLVENSNFKAFVATDRVFEPYSLKSDLQRRLPINLSNQFVYGCYTDRNSDAVILILNVASIAIHYKSETSDSTLTIFAKEFEDSVQKRKESAIESTFELPPQPEKVAVERVLSVQKKVLATDVETESEEDLDIESAEEQPEDQDVYAADASEGIVDQQEDPVEEQSDEDEPGVVEAVAGEDVDEDLTESKEDISAADESEPAAQTSDQPSEADSLPQEVPEADDEMAEADEADTLLEDAEASEDETTEIEEAGTVPEQLDVSEGELTEVEEADTVLEETISADDQISEHEESPDEEEPFEETIVEEANIEDDPQQTGDVETEDDTEDTDETLEALDDIEDSVSDPAVPEETVVQETEQASGKISAEELETVADDLQEDTKEVEVDSDETVESTEVAETDTDKESVDEVEQEQKPETVAAFTTETVMSSPEGLDDIEYDTTIPEESIVSDELTEQEEPFEKDRIEKTEEVSESDTTENTPQESVDRDMDNQAEEGPVEEAEETIAGQPQDSANEEIAVSAEAEEDGLDSSEEENKVVAEPVMEETTIRDKPEEEPDPDTEDIKPEDTPEKIEVKENSAESDEGAKSKPKKPDYLHVAKAIELDTPKPEGKSSKGRFFFIAAALFGLVIVFFVGPFQQQEPAIQPLQEEAQETAGQEPEIAEPVDTPEETAPPQEPPAPEKEEIAAEVKPEPIIIEETEVLPPQKPVEADTKTIDYVVKKGDYLFRITKTYTGDGYNYPKIQKENKIPNADLIYPDQVIKIKIEKKSEPE